MYAWGALSGFVGLRTEGFYAPLHNESMDELLERAQFPPGFPSGGKVVSLYAALDTIKSGSACVLQVRSFTDMKQSAGNVTVLASQALSITGHLSAGLGGPRLWARVEVAGTLFLSSLTVRDQSIAPTSYSDPLNGAGT